MIATEVIEMLHTEAKNISITSIYAPHNKDKASALAKRYNISAVYTDYAQLLQEDTADFLYVALVNSAHYKYVRQALEANRNVIVEKPFTLSLQEAEELAALATKKHLYLFEAISSLHMPNFQFVKNSLQHIAPIHLVQCNYSQYSSRYDRYLKNDIAPAFDPNLGGGALNDLNIYNIHFVLRLFGIPNNSCYYPNIGHNGVDTSGTLVLSYSQFTATCTAAKDSTSPSFLIIQGEKGWIRIPSTANSLEKVEMMIGGEKHVYQNNTYTSRLTNEFMDFKTIWENKDYGEMQQWLNHSLDVIRLLQECKSKRK